MHVNLNFPVLTQISRGHGKPVARNVLRQDHVSEAGVGDEEPERATGARKGVKVVPAEVLEEPVEDAGMLEEAAEWDTRLEGCWRGHGESLRRS